MGVGSKRRGVGWVVKDEGLGVGSKRWSLVGSC